MLLSLSASGIADLVREISRLSRETHNIIAQFRDYGRPESFLRTRNPCLS